MGSAKYGVPLKDIKVEGKNYKQGKYRGTCKLCGAMLAVFDKETCPVCGTVCENKS